MQPTTSSRLTAAAAALTVAGLGVLGALAAPAAAAPAGPTARTSGAFSSPPTGDECIAYAGGRCLTPAQLRTAYDLNGLHAAGTTGAGVSIGIVDSFGSPTIRNDIAVYDRQYGLPAIDLQIVTPAGAPPAFDAGDSDMAGWAGETTLDVEVAHTIAPGAKIVLIETPTSETEGITGFPDIITAENYVISHRMVDILSQSFAATEPTFSSPQQIEQLSAEVYPAAKAAGVTVLSSSGDSGPTDVKLDQKTLYTTPEVDWPASDPLVTAVGGTMLDIGADGSRQSADAVWSDGSSAAGGGRSQVFARPSFQASVAGVVGNHRGIPDISLDAAPSSGLITYSSFSGRDWSIGGGTSQAAPLMAGIVALADQKAHGRVGYLNDVLYGKLASQSAGVVDVTRGDNGIAQRSSVPGFPATTGYDLATGLGTLDGGTFVPALAAAKSGATAPLSAASVAASASSTPSASASAPVTSAAATPAAQAAGTSDAASTRPAGHGHRKAVAEIVILVLLVAVAAGAALAFAARRRRHP